MPRYTRVACVQLAVHPAISSERVRPMEDPLYGSSKHHDTLYIDAAPQALADRLEALRQRVGSSYREQLEFKLRAVLRRCREWGVRVVVFPEYAVPWQLLEVLAREAGPMLVVAGTHVVEREARRHDIYHRLGYQERPALAQAVCPVLHEGKIIALQPKLGFIPEEKVLGLKAGRVFRSIQTPEGVPGEMAVLICRDFLDRESEAHRQLVGEALAKCRFVAVPSYTPISSLPEFTAKAMESARRYGKPVLYANVTRPERGREGGGTTVYVDRIPTDELRNFPAQVGWLEPDDEGVIVADVDLSFVTPGPSTRYEEDLPVRAVAAASFVYPTDARDAPYAKWLEEKIAPLLERTDDDAVEDLSEAIQSADELLRGFASAATARGHRLAYLLREHGRMQDVESFRRCLREMVLPQDALPLPAVRSAMARGAAEALTVWQPEFPKVELAAVLQALEQAAKGQAPLSSLGAATFDTIAKAVRGEARSVQEKLESFRQALVTHLVMDDSRGARRFEEEDYPGALEEFRAALTKAEQVAAAAPDDKDLRHRVAILWLRIANCYIHLNDDVGATTALDNISAEEQAVLSSKERETYLILMAQLGKVARAKELLDAGAVVAEPERLREILSLLEGKIPETPPADLALRLLAASALIRKGRAATAVSWAVSAYQETPRKIIGRLGFIELLVDALGATIHEDPKLVEPVPIGERAAILEQIESGLAEIRGQSKTWPDTLREAGTRVALKFFQSIIDDERVHELVQASSIELLPAERDIKSLAKAGRVDEAEALLPGDGAPWARGLMQVRILWNARRFDEAIEQARTLATRYPGRVPIELNLARLLLALGHADEALAHAEVAFQLLPARSARVALGVACVAVGELTRGWTLLAPVADTKNADVLRARAIAAEQAAPAEARAAWQRYLKEEPDDLKSRLRLMLLSAPTARDETADEAWALFEGKRHDLSPDDLYFIAQLQPVDGSRGDEGRERINQVTKDLAERFRSDARAEGLRLMLLAKLDFPEDSSPVNYSLLADAGVAMKVSPKEVGEWFAEFRELQQNAEELYRKGLLPIEQLLVSLGRSAAHLFTELIEQHERAYLSTPVRIADPPVVPLANRELLVGEFELLLLQHLDLWEPLRRALGAKGELLVFNDVINRVRQASDELKSQQKPVARERNEELSRRMEQLSLSGRIERSMKPEQEIAREEGAALITDATLPPGVRQLSPWQLVEKLFQSKRIDRSMRERLEKAFPRTEGLDHALEEARSWVIDWVTLKRFFKAGALDELLEISPGPLRVGRDLTMALAKEQRRHRVTQQAANRAAALEREVQRGREEGWIRGIERPAVTQRLPPLKANEDDPSGPAFRDMVGGALAFKEALVDHPSLLLLTTDLIVAALFGETSPAELLKPFAWTQELLSEFRKRYRPLEERVISFAQLVPALVSGEREHSLRISLVELGVRDALSPATVLHLAHRYDGIESGVPARLLDIVEAPARMLEHTTRASARVRIGSLYARTIWEAYTGSERKPQAQELEPRAEVESPERGLKVRAEALAITLLGRTEKLDTHQAEGILDQLLMYLYGHAVSWPRAAFVGKSDAFNLSPESSFGRLLSTVLHWAAGRLSRRAALARAFRSALLVLDEAHRGAPSPNSSLPLVLAYRMVRDSDGQPQSAKNPDAPLALTHPEVEALAIMSADWPVPEAGPVRGLSKDEIVYHDAEGKQLRMSFEDVLRAAGTLIGKGTEEIFGHEASIKVPFELQGVSGSGWVMVAPEAIALRVDHDQYLDSCRAFANGLAINVGPHDGRLYDVIRDFADAPGQRQHRQALARHALTAPWRAVREDPLLILRWGRSFLDWPRNLGDLRRLLAEPERLPDGDLSQLLFRRVEEGGNWRDRLDALSLALQASEIPGVLSSVLISTILKSEDLGAEIDAALERLASPNDQPAARLARDIVLLRAASVRQPRVQIPTEPTPVDLLERLPALLARVIDAVNVSPGNKTLAFHEAGLLRLCRRIVEQLSEHEKISERDGLWMTWRLYQWYVAQLERQRQSLRPWMQGSKVQPESAKRIEQAVWEMLEPHFPAPLPAAQVDPKRADLLDPIHFERTLFDHRLATVLHALALAEVAVDAINREEAEGSLPKAPFISAEALIEPLLKIAARPLTELERGWIRRGKDVSKLPWNAAAALPDLALDVMLLSEPSSFTRLAPEVRLRWFERLPGSGEDTGGLIDSLVANLLAAAAIHVEKLGVGECAILFERARYLVRNPRFFPQAYALLARLQRPGEREFIEELTTLLLEHLVHPQAVMLFGEYLMAVSRTTSVQLPAAIERVLVAAVECGGNAVEFALGIGRLAYLGDSAGQKLARETLARLGTAPPYRDDPNFRQLLQLLGLDQEQ